MNSEPEEMIEDPYEFVEDTQSDNKNKKKHSGAKKVTQINKNKITTKLKVRKDGSRTQQILRNKKKAPKLYVSREEFQNALTCLEKNKADREKVKTLKCVPAIHHEERTERYQRSFMVTALEEARKCLLFKDWDGLARVLVSTTPLETNEYFFFPVLLKYAMICLCYNQDKNLLDSFLQGVLMCATDQEKKDSFKNLTCLER